MSWTQGSFTLMHVRQVLESTEFMAIDLSWQTLEAGVSVKTYCALAGNTLLLIDKMTFTGQFRGWGSIRRFVPIGFLSFTVEFLGWLLLN